MDISKIKFVSIDVSTCDEDADNRIFARPIELMPTDDGNFVLLCEKIGDNFEKKDKGLE